MKSKFYSLVAALLLILFSNASLKAQQQSITLLYPDGPNIEWAVGASYVVSWLNNTNGTVDIYFSSDAGATWSPVAIDLSGSTYNLNTVGFPFSKKCRIKVQSHDSPQIFDKSSHNFKTVEAEGAFISLEQPTGGEEWVCGNTYLISWTDNLNAPVIIELLMNNTSVGFLGTTTGSTFEWTIPAGLAASGKIYKIRIMSSITGSPTPPAVSGRFKIKNSAGTFIDVLQPDGGESWAKGTTHLISWNDDVPEPVNVELWKGNTMVATLAQNVVGSTYLWTISDALATGNNYRIYVRSIYDANLYGRSQGRFRIKDSEGTFIYVEQPNGGERWAKSTTHLISWNDDLPEPVNIELWKGGAKVSDLATGVTGSTYYWTIDAALTAGNGYRVYVRSTLDASLYDRSDAAFRITNTSGTYVEVIQPNGGESWARNSTYLISWIDDLPEPVNIELWKGNTKVTDIATDVVGSTYYWDIDPATTVGNNYRIYVRSTADANLYDRSDAKFAIAASTGTYVEVYQPNGGESWARGTAHLISWNDDFFEPVNIELWKGNSKDSDIATDVLGSTYVWTIPDTQTPGTNYRVKVFSTLDGTLKDFSDSHFSITASAGTYISLNQPNGGEVWTMGNSYWIAWEDDCPEEVNLELWKGNTKVMDIDTDIVGSTYIWSIPTTLTPAANYRVKVVSTLDNSLYDFSDAYFELQAAPMLSAYPNPANENVTIDMKNMEGSNFVIRVYDQFNKLIREYKTNADMFTLPTGDLANGIYFVKVNSGKAMSTSKVIVVH